jgi:uncharacterized repeat protein (TIGR04138 family)
VGEHVDFKTIRAKAGPFPPAAYNFVREGLAHTVGMVHGGRDAKANEPATTISSEDQSLDESRHVSGQELCLGLKDFAIRQYGLLAKSVLLHWHIKGTDDFGKIVFAMIDAGLMRKTDEDSLEDFVGVYDFEDVFGELPTRRN